MQEENIDNYVLSLILMIGPVLYLVWSVSQLSGVQPIVWQWVIGTVMCVAGIALNVMTFFDGQKNH